MNKKRCTIKICEKGSPPTGKPLAIFKIGLWKEKKKMHKRWNLLGDLFHMVSFEEYNPLK